MRRALTLLALAAAVTLTGCGTSSPDPAPAAPSTATVTPEPVSPPARIRIPSLDVDANIIDLGLQPDGTMEVPPDAKDAGWYRKSPVPGAVGPAVINAHVNWKGADGPFAHLDQLKPGDEVIVESADGADLTFAVDDAITVPKSNFPTEQVYGDTPVPQLRLVTCTGEFDAPAHSYKDNLVVFAKLAG